MSDIRSRLSDYFAAQHPHGAVISAYLFGSHARGAAHAESDVDVAVLLDREHLPHRDARSRFALRLNTDLISATHCNDVDVVVLGDVSPELADHAIDAGIRVFCRDEEADFRFALQTRIQHIDLMPFLRRTRRLKAEALRS